MGSGIAQVAAQTGHNVTLVDVNADLLKNSESIISKSLGRVAKKKFSEKPEDGQKYISEIMGRVQMTTDAADGSKAADLIIEAIVENVDIKRKLFSTLDAAAPEKTIFTSNTSSLPIGELAVATKRLDRFGGLHFFNPVPVMKLVEVIRIPETSDTTNNALLEFSKNMGKTSVQAKDTPGFIVNRLLVPYIMEAVKMVGRDDASIKDIDTAMKLGSGVPMGPLELADYVGLDTLQFIIKGWNEKYPDKQIFEPSELLNKMINEGKLGMKSGEGFYNYKK